MGAFSNARTASIRCAVSRMASSSASFGSLLMPRDAAVFECVASSMVKCSVSLRFSLGNFVGLALPDEFCGDSSDGDCVPRVLDDVRRESRFDIHWNNLPSIKQCL